MWTPANDKLAIFNTIINDPYLTQTMGVNRDYVLRQKDLPQEFDPLKIYILIYERPTEQTGNRIINNSVYQIDILVANTPQMCIKADLIAEQIHNLLNEKALSQSHTIRPIRNLGAITVNQATQYSRGEEFGVYNTIYGSIKT